jgi:hypothetical protein
MNIDLGNAAIVLKAQQLIRINASPWARIRCDSGMVWITQDGDPRDVVLAAGEQFTVDRPGAVVVLAIDGATLQLDGCLQQSVPAKGLLSRLSERLHILRELHLAGQALAEG